MVRTLANWFQREEPAVVKLLLRAVEILSRHENTGKQLRALQPYVLSCCYSADGSVVAKTFQVLRDLVDQLPWQHSAAFLIQLAFTLPPFLEEESEHLRLTAFEIYGALLAKVSRRVFVFPLRHQVLNLLILLVLHLEDANSRIAQISRPTLCHLATLLGWSKLRATFAEKDVWTILSALLQQETGRALWFLKQSVLLFRSPQVPIRRTAVWFAGTAGLASARGAVSPCWGPSHSPGSRDSGQTAWGSDRAGQSAVCTCLPPHPAGRPCLSWAAFPRKTNRILGGQLRDWSGRLHQRPQGKHCPAQVMPHLFEALQRSWEVILVSRRKSGPQARCGRDRQMERGHGECLGKRHRAGAAGSPGPPWAREALLGPVRRSVPPAGQIIQTLGAEEAREMDEVHAGQCKPVPAACPSDVVAGAQK
ncbi:uncharacterized protein LOC121816086 isoform X2 [Ovis aries]|uniref:uncharacterized protein LOC121816086 isoform X2 n=1 Tax=Ovis aries TaxID=9940 RepID=UPI002952803F|nr:uncharacterized protein LOC121816086 isoform X2 [Ovis aries]